MKAIRNKAAEEIERLIVLLDRSDAPGTDLEPWLWAASTYRPASFEHQ